MTLVLLLTAATGAWADSFSTEAYTADATLSAVSVTGDQTLTINEGVTVTVNNGLSIQSNATLTVTGGGSLVVNGAKGANGWDGNYPGEPGSPAIGGSGQLAIANATITATGGTGGNGGFDEYSSQYGGDGAPAVSGVSISIQTGSLTAIGGAGGIGGTSTVYNLKYPDGEPAKAFSSFPNISDATLSYSTDNVTYTKYESGNTTLYRYMKIEPLDGPKVTTNAASAQDLFTEASFEMPTSDVTVSYTLVRDMQDEANPVAFSGLPSSGKIIVKKGSDDKYQPAEALTIQLIDPLAAAEAQNIIAADGITIKVLVGAENELGAIDYDHDNPITLEAFLADMKPGYYWIKAESTDENSPYDGTVYSSEFTAVEKYDLTVKPANDFSKGKVESVTVGTETVTPDATTGEATKTGIALDTEVKLKAKKGYKIKSATAKQKEGETTVTVTINDTKTEASFKMPQYDVDASYTLKRDMSVDMPVTVQDAEQNSRFRVKKQGDTFVPADMNMEQIVALFTVHDDIEEKNLTANTDFTVQFFAVNEEGQKTGEAIPFNDFTFAPGNYVATAVAASNSNYSGETALSNVFTLFQGYEVTVPAGEYISYYQSEALYVEDENAVLYTIANVTATEAQLSDAIKVAPAETPLLVYNKSEQDKTFLLIPTTDDADEVTPAKEFKGSVSSGELPASSSTADYYALNGKAFVWVKYAIEIGANKCWLQIGDQPAAARAMTRSIVGGGDTTNMDDVRWQMEDGNYYDLQGRKVEKPNRKGIYIKGGKKVIVR